jgi:hypothetical protein
MPLWVNAANAVLVTSEYEGFGLACVEALACDVPVLSTPVGIAPFALAGIAGALCAPFDAQTWSEAVGPHLRGARPAGRGRGARRLALGGEDGGTHGRRLQRLLAGTRPATRQVID